MKKVFTDEIFCKESIYKKVYFYRQDIYEKTYLASKVFTKNVF